MRFASTTAGFLVTFLAIPLLAGIPAADQPQAVLENPIGELETIPLAGSLPGAAAEPTIRIVSAEGQDLILEFTLPGLQAQAVTIDEETYHLLSIEGGGVTGESGQPTLPTFARLIQIPDRSGVSFEITALETIELSGYRPFPAQPDRAGEFVVDRQAYARTGYPETERVRIGAPAIARNLRIVPLLFQPVRYDPARETIEVAQRIEVHLRFAGADLRNALTGAARPISTGFDELYQELVVNYESQGPRDGESGLLGEYLIICPDQSAVTDALQPLIEWRMRKGHNVKLVTTAATGSTRDEIKAYLEDAYNTWPAPPEIVCLIGDADGPIAIPCWSYGGGSTDFQYTQLDGDDPYSDILIGRISIEDVETLQLYVTKIVGYESTPYMEETDWYTRACLVGDPTSSGYTCIQIMQWVKTHLLRNGYTQVDTVFASPWSSQMVNALNQGDTVFSYRGFYGTSGFNNGHISSLTNGWKMPFAPTITCGTGSFSGGTARSEAWIRAGLPPDIPTGGIASVGTATTGTVTRYNNCVTYGFWRAVFIEDAYPFGEIFNRGKVELVLNYYENDPGGGMNHVHWNNLMGDPAGEIWTGVPQMISVSYLATIARGSNSVTVQVDLHGAPLEGAYVCLRKGDDTHVGGYTAADGLVELPVDTPSTGEMLVTVTKHNCYPHLGSCNVVDAGSFVGYVAHTIDDDASGSSSGNGDGQVNPAETIELPIQVENFGTSMANSVTGTLTCNDAYVTILDATETFGDIPVGGTAWCADDFDILIDGAAPVGHVIRLGLDLESGADVWHSLIDIPISSAEFAYDDITLYDMGTQLDPGDAGEISISILNHGDAAADGVSGTLLSQSEWITVTDAEGTFGDIGVGATGENALDRFAIEVDAGCFLGHVAAMVIHLEFSGGARDTTYFAMTVGTADTDDPTGPDAYGYYAFDNTDFNYVHAPTYAWVEIDPNHGGPGTTVGLSDYGLAQDDSDVVTLPFPFIFYGQAFTRATICSNGWVAMGSTYLTNWRNWYIPAAGAPDFLIAPMWDDLYQTGDDQVYHWFDADNHRYIVQWSRMRTIISDHEENFQVIFHDPAHYPTETGDGEIIFQYETFSNTGSSEHYCTVGIENGDQTIGVLITYFNQYNAGSPPIESGRAIKFATYTDVPTGILIGTVTNETNGGTPLQNATVELLESGRLLLSGPDGVYGGGVQTGVYTAVVSHPSFAPDTAFNVAVIEGETTTQDFALVDILPPEFSETTQLMITTDDIGPYVVETTVTEYSDFADLSLVYNVNGAGWTPLPMTRARDEVYGAGIPGQAHGSLVKYFISGEDVGGNAATDPAEAPWENYEFWVLEALFTEGMEYGAGNWFHYMLGDTFYDQWHLSVERNHTPGGSNSWKCGDEADDDYTNLAHGVLESPPITIDEDVTFSFWHWMDAEVSGAHAGYCYDGGLVEMSVDSGEWTQITPVGGYPYRIREGTTWGPFPAETEVFSGNHDWRQTRFDLSGTAGEVRFRFRFGTDGADTREGWHIDDVEMIPNGPGFAGADETREAIPALVALHPNTPNPFRATGSAGTLIRFDLPVTQRVRLQLFDPTGRLVRTLVDGQLRPGRHGVVWDGRDASAHPVGSGVYFCVFESGAKQLSRQVLLTR